MIENNFGKMMGFSCIKREEKETICEVEVTKDMLNPFNAIHGGVLFALSDEVCGYMCSLFYKIPVTLNSTFNYLKPAINNKKIIAKANVIKRGKTICVLEVNVFDENDLCLCNGTFTYMEIAK